MSGIYILTIHLRISSAVAESSVTDFEWTVFKINVLASQFILPLSFSTAILYMYMCTLIHTQTYTRALVLLPKVSHNRKLHSNRQNEFFRSVVSVCMIDDLKIRKTFFTLFYMLLRTFFFSPENTSIRHGRNQPPYLYSYAYCFRGETRTQVRDSRTCMSASRASLHPPSMLSLTCTLLEKVCPTTLDIGVCPMRRPEKPWVKFLIFSYGN